MSTITASRKCDHSSARCLPNSSMSAPEQIAGLLQVNVRIPTVIAPGPQPVIVRIGEASSQTGAFVSVS